MAVYLKYEGIEGEATHENHKKWIDVQSLQFGVGRLDDGLQAGLDELGDHLADLGIVGVTGDAEIGDALGLHLLALQ